MSTTRGEYRSMLSWNYVDQAAVIETRDKVAEIIMNRLNKKHPAYFKRVSEADWFQGHIYTLPRSALFIRLPSGEFVSLAELEGKTE